MKVNTLMVALVVIMSRAIPIGLVPFGAYADQQDLVQAIEHRQEEIRKMSAAMRVVGRFLKHENASFSDVSVAAETIRAVATDMSNRLFVPGTELGVGHSAARPDIWNNWDTFKESAVALGVAASRLATAAEAKDTVGVTTQSAAVARACSTCHRMFRQRPP